MTFFWTFADDTLSTRTSCHFPRPSYPYALSLSLCLSRSVSFNVWRELFFISSNLGSDIFSPLIPHQIIWALLERDNVLQWRGKNPHFKDHMQFLPPPRDVFNGTLIPLCMMSEEDQLSARVASPVHRDGECEVTEMRDRETEGGKRHSFPWHSDAQNRSFLCKAIHKPSEGPNCVTTGW